MFQTIAASIAVAAISYLLGSLSFSIIVSRILFKDDIRNYGSHSAGFTNILRTYGKIPALITLIGDFSKTFAAVFIARWIFSALDITRFDIGYPTGLFVLLGHLFPVYFGFRGGKGVLTSLGVLLVINPVLGLIILAFAIPVIFISGFVSLGSIFGAIAYPFATYIMLGMQNKPQIADTLFASLYAITIIVMHRQNIARLIKGTENSFRKKN